MYRAVTDLATMLGSPIVTFRDGTGREIPRVFDVPVITIDWSRCSRARQALAAPAWAARALESAIDDAECLVVHSLFRSHVQLVHRLAKAKGIPYVVVPHGALEPVLWKSKWLKRQAWMFACGSAYLRDATRIVLATAGEHRHAVETLGRSLPASVIPFGVPASPRLPTTAERDAARTALGLPVSRRLLLMLGRLDPVKRPREVLRGFCEGNLQGCDLVVAGMDGGVSAADLLAGLPVEFHEHVWFLGGLDARRRDSAVTACDGYLSWSRHESFGYAAAESMAAALPVILPPGHGLRSEIETIACGLFPERDDLEALTGALREFAAWPDATVRARGEAGRQWVIDHLDPANVGTAWRGLIDTVVKEPHGRPESRVS
jgi:glycosyltransferase involved in cell wall biosynthesis